MSKARDVSEKFLELDRLRGEKIKDGLLKVTGLSYDVSFMRKGEIPVDEILEMPVAQIALIGQFPTNRKFDFAMIMRYKISVENVLRKRRVFDEYVVSPFIYRGGINVIVGRIG